jgi:hypothetical protein
LCCDAAPWRLPVATANESPLPCRVNCRMTIEQGLRPAHRRGLSPRFYLRHTPTLANFKHLDDHRGRAHNARPATPSTGS